MNFVIVTGMSGSGKSEAMSIFEDLGYYCIDNLPPELISKIYELSIQSKGTLNKVAIGIDIRGYKFVSSLQESLDFIERQTKNSEILFLDCSDEMLVRRYKMTRKRHPLASEDNIINGIEKERSILFPIKRKAQKTIDTTNMTVKDLRKSMLDAFQLGNKTNNLTVSITSFGFKHGIPMDADLVFDVRFLPNPYYVPELKEKTGDDKIVRDYVMDSEASVKFLEKLEDMIVFLLPNYEKEGKNHLVIAIGCTGGRHRSVTFANLMYEKLADSEYKVFKKHRDITLH
ncbi:MAG: RNase adapter RapZ [Proteocatella sp.]